MRFNEEVSVLEAETRGIYEALLWLRDKGNSTVCI